MIENKRYQLKQEQLYYDDGTPIVNCYSDLIDTEDNDKVICSFANDIGTSKMVDLLNEQEAEIKKLKEMGQELYELDSKRSLYILQVMQKFARQYSQDSKEYDLLYRLGKELPINPNNLWPKEAFTEEELMEDD